jgi:hypothetical protein
MHPAANILCTRDSKLVILVLHVHGKGAPIFSPANMTWWSSLGCAQQVHYILCIEATVVPAFMDCWYMYKHTHTYLHYALKILVQKVFFFWKQNACSHSHIHLSCDNANMSNTTAALYFGSCIFVYKNMYINMHKLHTHHVNKHTTQ